MESEIPDVITLDVEMPRMDGLTFLEKIMSQHPIPVVMCSSLTDEGCATALRAMECGAVSIITKPRIGVKLFLEESRITICDAVKAAACVRPRRLAPRPTAAGTQAERRRDAGEGRQPLDDPDDGTGHRHRRLDRRNHRHLRTVLTALPADAPGIVIVQHMPEKFTTSFAAALDRECRITVKEAENNDTVMRGTALIAPGNRHTLLKRSGARYYVEVRDGPLVCRHRPSVDVLFRSAARYAGSQRGGRHHDRHGRRWRPWLVGNEGGQGEDPGAGRR